MRLLGQVPDETILRLVHLLGGLPDDDVLGSSTRSAGCRPRPPAGPRS